MADDVKNHEPSPDDVEVLVPTMRQYGIVQQGGLQILYTASSSDGRLSIMVHPDHVNRVLRAIEGSKLAEPLPQPREAPAPQPKPERARKAAAKK